MSVTSSPLIEALEFVAKNLRVPDYKYELVDEQTGASQTERFVSVLTLMPGLEISSLSEVWEQRFEQDQLPERALNLMFVVDRCFDVWVRKLSLDAELLPYFSQFRAHAFILALKREFDALDVLLTELGASAGRLLGWTPQPERARKQVLEVLDSAYTEVQICPDANGVGVARNAINQLIAQRENNFQKITNRLMDTERVSAQARMSETAARALINKVFAGQTMTPIAAEFVSAYWLQVVTVKFSGSRSLTLDEQSAEQTKYLRAVFCDQSSALFKVGDELIEMLSESVHKTGVVVPDSVWQALSQELITLLRRQEVVCVRFEPLDTPYKLDEFRSPEGSTVKRNVDRLNVGRWYLESTDQSRECLLAAFEDSGQYLFVNHLGMKARVESAKALADRIVSNQLKEVPEGTSLSDVFVSNLNGLSKVSKTQHEARKKAAEKARLEAFRIKEEQAQAAEKAKKQAADIAQRTRELVKKKEDAKRAKQEQDVLDRLSRLSLGAWVAIEKDGESARFKLAVKFAAKKRYVFVDKYGIKKVEFDESSLIEGVCAGRVEILNDGADFDDSLERVIGRMRMTR